ncbi:uncharacterized protein LOC110831274 [Zootermopsis nevadensis]|uniref:uncharacterized protein LOC110831274 n=1 Tax=Zootermopsis nevadensis TaxID=136037 RepID=UPI000B8E2D3C|nr:uncharacterized protein LOC110831274 [Zootermopsis nevadensis]XP_021922799.1 uncharacterized protein LOC110831274 [Zootermopsis nevadensis]XP_021922800.1 uncharacterized protein LOC110831274 [Zootermopsis nevadensis]
MSIIKMDNDVDVLSEKDSIGMLTDEVHVQSSLSIKEDETEMMNIKLEDFADTHEEEDPLGELPLIKSEHEASITLRKLVPDSYGETCLESSYDDNQIIDIKFEDVGGVIEEEDPLLITSPVITAELEDSINLQKVIPDSYGETCLESSYDDNQIIDIKVEDVGGVIEEEDPLLITSPVITAELEFVGCIFSGRTFPEARYFLDQCACDDITYCIKPNLTFF